MRYHPVPVQFDEDEKIVGGKLTFRQIGFLAIGIIVFLAIPFFLFFIPFWLRLIPMGYVAYQMIKFTFFKRFGWPYFDFWVKLRRCKKRQSEWRYRKSTGGGKR